MIRRGRKFRWNAHGRAASNVIASLCSPQRLIIRDAMGKMPMTRHRGLSSAEDADVCGRSQTLADARRLSQTRPLQSLKLRASTRR